MEDKKRKEREKGRMHKRQKKKKKKCKRQPRQTRSRRTMTGQGRLILHGCETNKKRDKQGEQSENRRRGHAKAILLSWPNSQLPASRHRLILRLQGANPAVTTEGNVQSCSLGSAKIHSAHGVQEKAPKVDDSGIWLAVGRWLATRDSRMKHETSTPRTLSHAPYAPC